MSTLANITSRLATVVSVIRVRTETAEWTDRHGGTPSQVTARMDTAADALVKTLHQMENQIT